MCTKIVVKSLYSITINKLCQSLLQLEVFCINPLWVKSANGNAKILIF